MSILVICMVSAMASSRSIVTSNACHVATPNPFVVQTNDVGIASANVIVNDFVDRFVAAYNAKKENELAALLGNETQHWILERLKKTGGKMEMKAKEVKCTSGKSIVATLGVSHSKMGNVIWNVQLQDKNGVYRLVSTEMPDVQKKNEQMKDAHVKAKLLVSAIDSNDIACVKPMFKNQKVAVWVMRAIERRSKVSLLRVRQNKTAVSVDFSVITDKSPVNENLLYSVEGFYAKEK